ncbi:hypothetical protein [Jannaschia sp. W003]|uniref:hypothetical protein n=1 Tax=Jannaschia sp. W003 TaxID=2867012 RepID=UPI0021A7DD55|nr:hypothetical protein [Jannaschia sp. W003]UWQ22930.1 hypothetical protein K3554_07865 [Jannaschia sp. W003]
MIVLRPSATAAALLALAACAAPPAAPPPAFSPPEASGLVGVRPYPGPADVCQVIGESARTVEYLDHTEILVGCPTVETGAIADRLAEGGAQVAVVGEWTLISIPQG